MRVAKSRLFLLLASAATSLAGAAFAGYASAGEILSVKNESANFREGPGEKHAIVYSADRFYPVEVLEKKDGWAKVKDFEGDEAWVAERLLTKQETVVIEGDRVNVRDKAGTTSEIVFKAERGEVFKVEERQGKWLRVVDANGDGGWVREDMVWGERALAAAPPKGKTKGELDDPAKAAPAGAAPEAAKAAPKPKGADAPESGDKPAEKGGKPEAETPKKGAPSKGDPESKPSRAAEKVDAPPAKAEEKAAPAEKAEEKEAPAEKAEEKEAPAEKAEEKKAPEKEASDADAG